MENKNQIKEGDIVDVDFRNSKYLRGVKVIGITKSIVTGKFACELEIPVGFEDKTTTIKDVYCDYIKLSE